MASIIHTYRTFYNTIPNPPGFGDFLRGTLTLYELSERYNFNLVIDFSKQPIAEYLKDGKNVLQEPTREQVYEFFNKQCIGLEPFIRDLKNTSIVYLSTNGFPGILVSNSGQKFMRNQLIPSEELSDYISRVLDNLKMENYCVIHLRTGDNSNNNGFNPDNPYLGSWLSEIIIPEWRDQLILISDNNSVKSYLSKKYGIKIFPGTPVHLGRCAAFSPFKDSIRDSMGDFFMMSLSRKIYQYSTYPWGSGFSEMCSKIYDIPLEIISDRPNLRS